MHGAAARRLTREPAGVQPSSVSLSAARCQTTLAVEHLFTAEHDRFPGDESLKQVRAFCDKKVSDVSEHRSRLAARSRHL